MRYPRWTRPVFACLSVCSLVQAARLGLSTSNLAVRHCEILVSPRLRRISRISRTNTAQIIIVFCPQVVVQLCRSCNRVDKPYLMLRITSLCCDAAIMEYGPAIQASLGGVQLIDKLHTGTTGQYLELIATEPGADVAILLYRKVKTSMNYLLILHTAEGGVQSAPNACRHYMYRILHEKNLHFKKM